MASVGADPAAVRAAIPRFTIGNAAYLAGIGVAFLNPLLSLLIYGLVAVYYVFPTLPAPQSDRDEQARTD
jgi:hypothetical protein